MLSIRKAIYLIIGIGALAISHASALTEENVRQLIARIDNAVNALDANALAKEFSNDVAITLHINIQGHEQIMRPSKNEYIALLEQAWAQFSNYKYSKSNLRIDMRGGKAIVSALVHESMTIQGRELSGSSTEKVTIEMFKGKPVITEVVAYSNM